MFEGIIRQLGPNLLLQSYVRHLRLLGRRGAAPQLYQNTLQFSHQQAIGCCDRTAYYRQASSCIVSCAVFDTPGRGGNLVGQRLAQQPKCIPPLDPCPANAGAGPERHSGFTAPRVCTPYSLSLRPLRTHSISSRPSPPSPSPLCPMLLRAGKLQASGLSQTLFCCHRRTDPVL